MANREWFITKVVGLLLGLCLLVSTAVGAGNLILSLRRDVDRNERTILDHKKDEEKKFDKIDGRIGKTEADVSQLKLDTQKNAQFYGEIMRELSEMKSDNRREFDSIREKLDQFEVVQ